MGEKRWRERFGIYLLLSFSLFGFFFFIFLLIYITTLHVIYWEDTYVYTYTNVTLSFFLKPSNCYITKSFLPFISLFLLWYICIILYSYLYNNSRLFVLFYFVFFFFKKNCSYYGWLIKYILYNTIFIYILNKNWYKIAIKKWEFWYYFIKSFYLWFYHFFTILNFNQELNFLIYLYSYTFFVFYFMLKIYKYYIIIFSKFFQA